MMGVMTTIFAQTTGTKSALVAFVIYTLLVLVIAAFALLLLGSRALAQQAPAPAKAKPLKAEVDREPTKRVRSPHYHAGNGTRFTSRSL